VDIRNLNAAGISESESEPSFDADSHHTILSTGTSTINASVPLSGSPKSRLPHCGGGASPG
jgi:hypothetical protein